MRIDSDDPAHLTLHERLLEIGAILAAGIHRLRAGAVPTVPTAPVGPEPPITAALSPQIPTESSLSGLEVCAPTRPDGSRRQPEMTRED